MPEHQHAEQPPDHETLADALVPIAAELVGVVRDYGPADVAQVLARVPAGRYDALAVVLAAMVDPDARPSQLLAWTELGPVPSRDFTPSAFRDLSTDQASRVDERRTLIARLTADGWGPTAIAKRLGITKRSVVRHRTALRTEQAA